MKKAGEGRADRSKLTEELYFGRFVNEATKESFKAYLASDGNPSPAFLTVLMEMFETFQGKLKETRISLGIENEVHISDIAERSPVVTPGRHHAFGVDTDERAQVWEDIVEELVPIQDANHVGKSAQNEFEALYQENVTNFGATLSENEISVALMEMLQIGHPDSNQRRKILVTNILMDELEDRVNSWKGNLDLLSERLQEIYGAMRSRTGTRTRSRRGGKSKKRPESSQTNERLQEKKKRKRGKRARGQTERSKRHLDSIRK